MELKSYSQVRAELMRIYAEAIKAVLPERLIGAVLDEENAEFEQIRAELVRASGVRILAVGKAAVGMVQAMRARLADRITDMLVIAPTVETPAASLAFPVLWSSHPTPDISSEIAGRRALEFAARTEPDELLLLLLSGGASALMAAPAAGITIKEKANIANSLMRAGASIFELNAVRKHLSQIKGGGLLRALKNDARVLNLIISDVPGNDLGTIGSGPTVADSTTFADAIAVLKRRKLWGRTPEAIRDHLERGAAGAIEETVKPGEPLANRPLNLIIGDNRTAREAAIATAAELGYAVEPGPDLSREAELVGRELARRLYDARDDRVCVVSGGEPTVLVKGDGKGGRAQHCALAAAIELNRLGHDRRIAALCAGTDGIDGPTDAAGAIISAASVNRAREAGLDAQRILGRSDSYEFFRALGDLIVIGPTGANVCDLFIGLANY